MQMAVFVMFLVGLASNGVAGPPDTLWTRRFGGEEDEWGWWVEECHDGGFVLTGWSNSYPPRNMRGYLVRTNSHGDTLWSRVLSFSTGTVFQTYCVRQTSDRGYIVLGYTNAYSYDAVLWRFDSSGHELWQEHYGGSGTEADYLFEVAETPDNGFIATGHRYDGSDHNLYLLKTDSAGRVDWERLYGRPEFYERGEAVINTADGGYAVVGIQGNGIWLLRLNQDGDTLWTRGFGSGVSSATSLLQMPDSGFVFAGYVARGLYSDGYIARTRANGDTVWTRKVGTYELDEKFCSVASTADGGFVCGGWHYPNPNDINTWLVRFNSAGDTLWAASYGNDTTDDYCYSAREVSTDGYILCGRTDWQTAGRFDIWLVRTGPGIGIDETPSAELRAPNRGPTIVNCVLYLSEAASGERIAKDACLLDIAGRRVLSLHPGPNDLSRLAPSVYFGHSAIANRHSAMFRVVITK
ncbi:MAG: hypothetical protein ABIK86_04115 [candidate division WOR-3 bacterium]